MNQVVNIVVGLILGALIVIQSGMNTRMTSALGGSIPATLVNFLVGTLCLLGVALATGQIGLMQGVVNAPRWSWLGGLAGVVVVLGTIVLVPRIGTAHMVALVVLGQALTGLVVDHYGWLGVPQIDISSVRVIGCGLLAIGAILIGR